MENDMSNNQNNDQLETQSIANSMMSSTSKHGKHLAKHCTGCIGLKLIANWTQHIQKGHFGDVTINGVECKLGCWICSNYGKCQNSGQKMVLSFGTRGALFWYPWCSLLVPVVLSGYQMVLSGYQMVLSGYHGALRVPWCSPGTKWCSPDNQSTDTRKTNRNKLIRCYLCNNEKRSDKYDKGSAICKVCLTPPKVKAQKILPQKMTQKRSYAQYSCQQPPQRTLFDQQASSISDQLSQIDIVDVVIDTKEETKQGMMPPPKKKMVLNKDFLCGLTQQKQVLSAQFQLPISSSAMKTMYISQGMRDDAALAILEEIEKGGCEEMDNEAKLIDVLPSLTQQLLITYLTQTSRPIITSTLQGLMRLAPTFNERQLISIVFTATILEVQTWCKIPQFIRDVTDKVAQWNALKGLSTHLASHFDSNIGNWIIMNWQYLSSQTFDLVVDLKKNPAEEASQMLDISLVVNSSEDIDKFRLFCRVFFPSQDAYHLFQEALKNQPQQVKLSLKQFAELSFELRKVQNQQCIQENRTMLTVTPFTSWMSLIQTWQTKVLIQDVDSVQSQLDALQKCYGRIPMQFRKDIGEAMPTFSYLMSQLTTQPNNVQTALAWYAATMIFHIPLQMLILGAGQGKSILEKLITFFLLKTKSTTRVHLVYVNKKLLERDKETFQELIIKGGLAESQISFQLGLNFQSESSDIMLVDEADQLLFADPQAFKSIIARNHCICLTATSDDCDVKGVEKAILNNIGFALISPVGVTLTNTKQPLIDKVLKIYSNKELYQFIESKLKTQAVLLYCTIQMKNYLLEQQQEFLYVDHSDSVQAIAKMDQVQHNGKYLLAVSTDPKVGMRGLDYRAPLNGITLVLQKSFENQREATQGLYRVGRYQDPCERISVEGVPLVDPLQESRYFGRLLAFVESYSKQTTAKVSTLAPKLKNAKVPTFVDNSQNKITKFIVRQEQHKQ